MFHLSRLQIIISFTSQTLTPFFSPRRNQQLSLGRSQSSGLCRIRHLIFIDFGGMCRIFRTLAIPKQLLNLKPAGISYYSSTWWEVVGYRINGPLKKTLSGIVFSSVLGVLRECITLWVDSCRNVCMYIRTHLHNICTHPCTPECIPMSVCTHMHLYGHYIS